MYNKYCVYFFAFAAILFFAACNNDAMTDDEEMMEQTADCSDGIQNGDETGIDCGGDCDPCVQGPPSSGFYFYGIIDGAEFTEDSFNGVGGDKCTADEIHVGWAGWIINLDTEETGAEIGVIKAFEEAPSSFMDYYDMYEEGSRTYGNCESGIAGVEIIWRADNGEKWYSKLGAQDESTFIITDRASFVENSLNTEIKGTFSCKLYKEGSNDVVTIADGEFSTQVPLF